MSLFSELNAQGSVLRAALRGTATRNEIIVNNIVNADVPGFRAREVEFEEHLQEMIGTFPLNRSIDLENFSPTVRFRNPGFHYRTDGNSVDIDVEMVSLYQNSMRFDTIVSSVMVNSERMRTVLQGQ
ncbi:MAG: flagellar basal body rod protein FlgB [Defluviitaleaceae bacterium]|nr:flagellar basal body rod protein FlgB [Defluviitaleaceae bacterium]